MMETVAVLKPVGRPARGKHREERTTGEGEQPQRKDDDQDLVLHGMPEETHPITKKL